ncbi:MAG: hypothetical protein QE271_04050 [Bacteriovoracaceae bacterium]|nr:hypothetical protein [Bacteriovoracaceae bacterium]
MKYLFLFLVFLSSSGQSTEDEVERRIFRGAAIIHPRPGTGDFSGDLCVSIATDKAEKKCIEAGYSICKRVYLKEHYIFPFPKVKRCVVKLEGSN